MVLEPASVPSPFFVLKRFRSRFGAFILLFITTTNSINTDTSLLGRFVRTYCNCYSTLIAVKCYILEICSHPPPSRPLRNTRHLPPWHSNLQVLYECSHRWLPRYHCARQTSIREPHVEEYRLRGCHRASECPWRSSTRELLEC